MQLSTGSISYIDNRKFPGVEGVVPPGPLGYQFFTFPDACSIIPNFMFLLNGWFADGLLVHFSFDAALTFPGVQCILRCEFVVGRWTVENWNRGDLLAHPL